MCPSCMLPFNIYYFIQIHFCDQTADPVLYPFEVINLHEDLNAQTYLVQVNCTDTDDSNNRCSTCNIVAVRHDGLIIFAGVQTAPFDIFKLNNGFFNNLRKDV